MILYPILAQISISYLYLFHFSKHCCVSQSQRVSWSLAAFLCNKCCSLYSALLISGPVCLSIFEKKIIWFHEVKFQIVLPYAQSTTSSTLFILCIEFVRYFDDIVTPTKIWI